MNYLEKALNILYELRKIYYDNELIHIKYAGFFISLESEINKIDYISNINEVAINSAVKTQLPDGSIEWYIIDNSQNISFKLKELNSSHPTAQVLLGKKVGDSFLNRKILEIIHKYIYACRETLYVYPTYFPTSTSIESFELPNDGEGILESLRPLLDKQQAWAQMIEQLYNSGQLTVGAIAEITKRNPIKIWASLISNADTPLIANLGNTELEKQKASDLLNDNATLVLDIIAILTIHELGIADIFKSTYTNLSICWPTYHLITEFIDETSAFVETGYITLTKEDNAYVKHEIHPQALTKQIKFFESMKEWIINNCNIEPVYEILLDNRDKENDVSNLLGISFYQSLLLSTKKNYVLYSDDVKLRELVRNEYNNIGIWTQDILFNLLNRNLINNQEFSDSIVKLVKLNYDYISINSVVLLECLRRNEFNCNHEEFIKIIDYMITPRTTFSSISLVLTHFFYDLWKENVSSETKEKILVFILNKIYLMAKLTNIAAFNLSRQALFPTQKFVPINQENLPINMLSI